MQCNKIIQSNILSEQRREQLIRYIFTCLRATYGNNFIDNYKSGTNDSDGIDIGLKNAYKFWRKKLNVFFNTIEGQQSIQDALDNLPTYPPNLIQFFESAKLYYRRNIQKQQQKDLMNDLKQERNLTSEEQEQNIRKIQNLIANLKNKKFGVF